MGKFKKLVKSDMRDVDRFYSTKIYSDRLDDAWEIIESRDKHMGIDKEKFKGYDIFEYEYQKEKWFNDDEDSYQMVGTFDKAEKDENGRDKLLMISGYYKWAMMPYATGANWFGHNMGIRSLGITMLHHKAVLDYIKDIGICRIYLMNAYSEVTRGKKKEHLGDWNSMYGDEWCHCIEEIIEAGRPTRWRGFQVLTGFKTWPVKMMVRSFTLRDWGSSNL